MVQSLQKGIHVACGPLVLQTDETRLLFGIVSPVINNLPYIHVGFYNEWVIHQETSGWIIKVLKGHKRSETPITLPHIELVLRVCKTHPHMRPANSYGQPPSKMADVQGAARDCMDPTMHWGQYWRPVNCKNDRFCIRIYQNTEKTYSEHLIKSWIETDLSLQLTWDQTGSWPPSWNGRICSSHMVMMPNPQHLSRLRDDRHYCPWGTTTRACKKPQPRPVQPRGAYRSLWIRTIFHTWYAGKKNTRKEGKGSLTRPTICILRLQNFRSNASSDLSWRNFRWSKWIFQSADHPPADSLRWRHSPLDQPLRTTMPASE